MFRVQATVHCSVMRSPLNRFAFGCLLITVTIVGGGHAQGGVDAGELQHEASTFKGTGRVFTAASVKLVPPTTPGTNRIVKTPGRIRYTQAFMWQILTRA